MSDTAETDKTSELEKKDNIEEESAPVLEDDDITEDDNGENADLEDEPAEDKDGELEDNEVEDEGEESLEEAPPDTDKIEENKEEKPQDKHKKNIVRRKKILQILKWAAIIFLPLIAAATLYIENPAILTNLLDKIEQIRAPKTTTATATQWTPEEQEMVNIVDRTLTETEKIWNKIFTEKGGAYKKPDVKIFTNRTQTTCNQKDDSETFSLGSFYCPEETRVYIDLSLHRNLRNRLDIPGDFAQGYIVAHEIGHHIQNLTGISEQIPAARLQLTDKEFEMIVQRLELQADCYAGIWAKHTAKQLYTVEPEDFADALNAVTHFSRQHLRQKEGDELMPDPFTHGSSRLRNRWFTIGYTKGTLDSCDTFITMDL